MSEIIFAENTSGANTPSTGRVTLYPKNDGSLYFKNDLGVEQALGARILSILVTDPNGSDIATGDGQAYVRINEILDGWILVAVGGQVQTVSSGGPITVQIHNVSTGLDLLNPRLVIDVSEFDSSTATQAVVTSANAEVSTGQRYRVDVDTAGIGAKGLIVDLTFAPKY